MKGEEEGKGEVERNQPGGEACPPRDDPSPATPQIFTQVYQSEGVCRVSGFDWKRMKELSGRGKFSPGPILRSCGWTNNKIDTGLPWWRSG